MKMKKLLAVTLCLVMAFGLTACGSSKKSSSSTETKKSDVKADEVSEKTVFVSPKWLESVIDGNQPESKNYIILECSWGKDSVAKDYKKAHIAGAFHMNTDNIEESKYWNIKSANELANVCKDFGITSDTTLICYGVDGKDAAATRVAFAMLYEGVKNVKVLNGGMNAWTKAGYKTDKGLVKPKSTDKEFGVKVPAHPEYIMSIDQVKKELKSNSNFKLVSIRSKDEFLGKTSGYSYIKKAGEPKGAIWGHNTDEGAYLNIDGTVVGTNVLANYLKESKATLDNQLAFYCGTGWRATIPFFIMYQEGYTNMSVYDGGWFQWQMDNSNPVQIGDPLTGDVKYTTVGKLSDDKAVKS
ncbi:MAG: sulfurtransferase [Lachnospiraceae bacterium]|jgi:thiosulfate/3-mercaptopyruvate sulfurtransferase|nr:sulfurtransferase [Lachnospiraceae bacterium]